MVGGNVLKIWRGWGRVCDMTNHHDDESPEDNVLLRVIGNAIHDAGFDSEKGGLENLGADVCRVMIGFRHAAEAACVSYDSDLLTRATLDVGKGATLALLKDLLKSEQSGAMLESLGAKMSELFEGVPGMTNMSGAADEKGVDS